MDYLSKIYGPKLFTDQTVKPGLESSLAKFRATADLSDKYNENICKFIYGPQVHGTSFTVYANFLWNDAPIGLILHTGIQSYQTNSFNKKELVRTTANQIDQRKKQLPNFNNLLSLQMEHNEMLGTNELDIDLIKKLQEYILIKTDRLSVEALAKKLFTSRTQLHRKVKALTGMSTTHYLNSIRIKNAKHLLETTQLTISEIAYDVGFDDPSYFSKIFKRLVHSSPVAYRQKAASNLSI